MSVERTAEEPKAESKDSGRQLDLLEEIGGPPGRRRLQHPGDRSDVGGPSPALWLAQGESLRFALAGLIGVAVAAFIADRTGRAEDFFLPGLLPNAVYGSNGRWTVAPRKARINLSLSHPSVYSS